MNIRDGKQLLLEQLFQDSARTVGRNKLPDGSKFLTIETIAQHFNWDLELTQQLIFDSISNQKIAYQEKGMMDNPRLRAKAFLKVL